MSLVLFSSPFTLGRFQMDFESFLRKSVGLRLTVRGFFSEFGHKRDNRTGGPSVTMLVQEVHCRGEYLRSRMWIQDAFGFQNYGLERGERLEFSARLGTYSQSDGRWDYSLQCPDDIVRLDRAPFVPPLSLVTAIPGGTAVTQLLLNLFEDPDMLKQTVEHLRLTHRP